MDSTTGSWVYIVTFQRGFDADTGLTGKVNVIRVVSRLVRDAGGSRTHFKLLCRQRPGRLAPASYSISREGIVVTQVRLTDSQNHVDSSTSPGSRTPSCGSEDHRASITLARHGRSSPTRSRTWSETLGESCAVRYTIEPQAEGKGFEPSSPQGWHALAVRPGKPYPATFRTQVAGPGVAPGNPGL